MAKTNIFRDGKAMGLVIMYLIVFAATWACEEEDDPIVSDPSVSIFFLNRDSLDQVSFIVDSLDMTLVDYDSIIASLETSADKLVDSLIVLTDSIANGGDLKSDSTTVVNDLDTLQAFLLNIEKEDSTVNATRSEWATVASVINSGAVVISSIENKKNGQSIFYEDSSAVWNLPLDMQADEVDVDITIANKVYNLVLGYGRVTTTDERNKIVIRTSDFEIISTDFVNSSLSCQGCDDTKTTIHVEF